MSSVRIGSDSEIGKTDYSQPAQFARKDFYCFRNAVVRALRQFGSVGPLGEANLLAGDGDDIEFIGESVDKPDFFVVSDMYNEHDRISLVECDARCMTDTVIESLIEVAARFPNWYVIINMGDSGLRVFGNAVLVGGRRFWDCSGVAEIGDRCGRDIDYGAAPESHESMYGLWVDLLCGGFKSAKEYPDPPEREWSEVMCLLDFFVRQAGGAPLRAAAYERVRYDLHPETRWGMLERLLSRFPGIPPARIQTGKRNLRQDIADALAMRRTDSELSRLARLVSSAQFTALGSFNPKDIVFWWPDIIHKLLDNPNIEGLRIKPILVSEMRSLLDSDNQWIQLSGIFALAKLGATDIANVVDKTLQANKKWLANSSLLGWLLQIRAGSARYPNGLVLQ